MKRIVAYFRKALKDDRNDLRKGIFITDAWGMISQIRSSNYRYPSPGSRAPEVAPKAVEFKYFTSDVKRGDVKAEVPPFGFPDDYRPRGLLLNSINLPHHVPLWWWALDHKAYNEFCEKYEKRGYLRAGPYKKFKGYVPIRLFARDTMVGPKLHSEIDPTEIYPSHWDLQFMWPKQVPASAEDPDIIEYKKRYNDLSDRKPNVTNRSSANCQTASGKTYTFPHRHPLSLFWFGNKLKQHEDKMMWPAYNCLSGPNGAIVEPKADVAPTIAPKKP
eukprot:TRINITY_DN11818_c0_g1_i1.p1 TRINITY_DN11818_c0_g1~~TRINITY_DN11818_c0_g1_i1.p1  ORF type:complete len:306 (+),score=34.45 TRINITY_DN11818_c0_g1_i1:98-919(+)